MKFRLLLIIFIAFVALFLTIVVVVWFEVLDLTTLQSPFTNGKMTTTENVTGILRGIFVSVRHSALWLILGRSHALTPFNVSSPRRKVHFLVGRIEAPINEKS